MIQSAPSKSYFIDTMEVIRAETEQGTHVSVGRFFELLGGEGHAVLLIFLCLPYMQPIPIPGLSTPFGILIAIVSHFLYLKKPAVLPKRFAHLQMSSSLILKIIEVAEKIWSKIHRHIFERWPVFSDLKILRQISLVIVVINAILLALPLPIPLSNTFPAAVILLNSLGQMERDGLFIVLSYIACILSFAFFAALSLGTVWSLGQVSIS